MNRLCTFAACLVLVLTSHSNSFAGFFFNVESATFSQDLANPLNPTSGSVNVFITSDNPAVDFATPPNINSYVANLDASGFTGTISSVTFQPATISTAPHTPLFPSTPNTFLLGTNSVGVSTALADLGLNPPLFNNAGLFRLNFTVPALQSGTFNLSFVDTAARPTDLVSSTTFSDISSGFNGGTITIAAVPEPSTIFLGGLALAGVAVARKRRAKKAVSI